MNNHNLGLAVSVLRLSNAVAAGATASNSSSVDMLGWDGVFFIAAAGAITATAVSSVKAQQSSDNGSADDFTDIAGSSSPALTPATDDNKILLIDIYRPQKRYLRLSWVRSTANTVIDGVFAIRYHGVVTPAALDATVKSLELFSNPPEGTA